MAWSTFGLEKTVARFAADTTQRRAIDSEAEKVRRRVQHPEYRENPETLCSVLEQWLLARC
jgi:hypothetical protein